MTAAWRGLGGFAGRSSLRAWLYRIATNRCVNAIRDAKRRPLTEPIPPFDPPAPTCRGDVTWLQPYPDAWLDQAADLALGPAGRYHARETVELAFIAALQRLPPRQTAVVVLCDVLDFPTAEVTAMLSASPTAVKGLLQRARAALDRERAAAAPNPGSDTERDLAQRFADAFTADDVDRVVALLTDDAWLAMPPAPHQYHRPDAIAAFLRASTTGHAGHHLRLVAIRANSQPAFACYLAEPGDPVGRPTGVLVLALSGAQIRTITRFLDPDVSSLFRDELLHQVLLRP